MLPDLHSDSKCGRVASCGRTDAILPPSCPLRGLRTCAATTVAGEAVAVEIATVMAALFIF